MKRFLVSGCWFLVFTGGCVKPERITGTAPVKNIEVESRTYTELLGTGYGPGDSLLLADTAGAVLEGRLDVLREGGRLRVATAPNSAAFKFRLLQAIPETLQTFYFRFDISLAELWNGGADVSIGIASDLAGDSGFAGVRFTLSPANDSLEFSLHLFGKSAEGPRVGYSNFRDQTLSLSLWLKGDSLILSANGRAADVLPAPIAVESALHRPLNAMVLMGQGIKVNLFLDNPYLYR